MRRSIVALGALIAAAGIFQMPTPAKANIDYPFCRAGKGEGGYGTARCDYSTLEQCQATASGLGGFCVTNPNYNSNANARYRGAARRHR
jgi:hypothetical protein